MDDSTFEQLLDRHGSSIDRWPVPYRDEASALLARSPAAARALGEMRRVENALRMSFGDALPDASLVAARASRHRQWSRADQTVRRAAWGASAAAALVFGLLIGQATSPEPEDGAGRFIAAALDLPIAAETSGNVDVD